MTIAYYSAPAKLVFDRLDEKTRRLIRAAVKGLASNPKSGYWLREVGGYEVRMLPVDGLRLYYVLWESELTITEILSASNAPSFPV